MVRHSWPAPAKLNLLLRVIGRRSDGYHLLQTAFQFIDLCDDIEIHVRSDGEIRALHRLPGVDLERDLVVRAARLLQRRGKHSRGADIRVTKRIPMGGGLGGGSSDAATVLVALNCLWGLGYGTERLAELGLELGADVPVFIRGEAAWAEGVGERLTPLVLPTPWYLVIFPGIGVATADVFRDPHLTRNSPPIRIPDFLAGDAANDCEGVVRERYSEVDEALRWLRSFGNARLTGTGSCVFADFALKQEALLVGARVPSRWQAIVSRGYNVSPLRAAASGAVGNLE